MQALFTDGIAFHLGPLFKTLKLGQLSGLEK